MLCNCCKLNDSTGPQHWSAADKYLVFPTVRSRLLCSERDDARFYETRFNFQPTRSPRAFPLVSMQQFLWKGYKISKVETQETKVNLILLITWQQVSKFYLVVLEAFSYFIIRFQCTTVLYLSKIYSLLVICLYNNNIESLIII